MRQMSMLILAGSLVISAGCRTSTPVCNTPVNPPPSSFKDNRQADTGAYGKRKIIVEEEWGQHNRSHSTVTNDSVLQPPVPAEGNPQVVPPTGTPAYPLPQPTPIPGK